MVMRGGRVQGALTVVELMVVVIVISILAGLLWPLVDSMRTKAGLSKCTFNLRQIGVAAGAYSADREENGLYRCNDWALDWPHEAFAPAFRLYPKYTSVPDIFFCPLNPLTLKANFQIDKNGKAVLRPSTGYYGGSYAWIYPNKNAHPGDDEYCSYMQPISAKVACADITESKVISYGFPGGFIQKHSNALMADGSLRAEPDSNWLYRNP